MKPYINIHLSSRCYDFLIIQHSVTNVICISKQIYTLHILYMNIYIYIYIIHISICICMQTYITYITKPFVFSGGTYEYQKTTQKLTKAFKTFLHILFRKKRTYFQRELLQIHGTNCQTKRQSQRTCWCQKP